MIGNILDFIWIGLGIGSVIALIVVSVRVAKTAKRISRSIDPINQKVKGLKLEVSALKHSRTDRVRRLNTVQDAETIK